MTRNMRTAIAVLAGASVALAALIGYATNSWWGFFIPLLVCWIGGGVVMVLALQASGTTAATNPPATTPAATPPAVTPPVAAPAAAVVTLPPAAVPVVAAAPAVAPTPPAAVPVAATPPAAAPAVALPGAAPVAVAVVPRQRGIGCLAMVGALAAVLLLVWAGFARWPYGLAIMGAMVGGVTLLIAGARRSSATMIAIGALMAAIGFGATVRTHLDEQMLRQGGDFVSKRQDVLNWIKGSLHDGADAVQNEEILALRNEVKSLKETKAGPSPDNNTNPGASASGGGDPRKAVPPTVPTTTVDYRAEAMKSPICQKLLEKPGMNLAQVKILVGNVSGDPEDEYALKGAKGSIEAFTATMIAAGFKPELTELEMVRGWMQLRIALNFGNDLGLPATGDTKSAADIIKSAGHKPDVHKSFQRHFDLYITQRGG